MYKITANTLIKYLKKAVHANPNISDSELRLLPKVAKLEKENDYRLSDKQLWRIRDWVKSENEGTPLQFDRPA
jgi:hypothetical protein